MISSFSEAGYLIRLLPIRRHAFFENTVLQGQIGDHLLEPVDSRRTSEVAARAIYRQPGRSGNSAAAIRPSDGDLPLARL